MTDERIVRAPSTRAWSHRDTLTVLSRDGRALRFDGASADLALAVYELLALPRTRAEVLAYVAERSGEPLTSTAPVEQLLGALASIGAIAAPPPSARATSPRRVVLCVSGAVSAAHAPALLTRMLGERWDVRLSATPSALRFVARDALEAIAGTALVTSHWQRGDGRARAHHVELAEWAELVLVYPASATTLSRIARGDCSDVVSATVIATRAPVVLAPSMNAAMYAAPSVERNLRQLRDDGHYVIVPAAGVEVAHAPPDRAPMLGPAPSPDDVFAVARAVLSLTDRPQLPSDVMGWDALYQRVPARDLPWFAEAPEADLAAALQALCHAGMRALDLGTGTGTVALHLAALGCHVIATDVSPAALDLARARDASHAVDWRLDDVASSALEGPFDLVVDRACLHSLPRERHAAWRDTLVRVSAPDARLALLVHDVSEEAAAGTFGYDEAGLRAFLAPACDEVRVAPSTMRGARGPSRRAWLCTARVRGVAVIP